MPTKPKSPYLPFGDQQTAPGTANDILSVRQFARPDLEYISASLMRCGSWWRESAPSICSKGKILANLFYEPSTRTFSSFMAAMQRLGGAVIPIMRCGIRQWPRARACPIRSELWPPMPM
jgi:hypothetical protein